jgi:hypothetical protein
MYQLVEIDNQNFLREVSRVHIPCLFSFVLLYVLVELPCSFMHRPRETWKVKSKPLLFWIVERVLIDLAINYVRFVNARNQSVAMYEGNLIDVF